MNNEQNPNLAADVQAFFQIEEDLKKQYPELTDESLMQRGIFSFSIRAIIKQDVKTWAAAQEIKLKKDELAIRKSKLDLEWQKENPESGAEGLSSENQDAIDQILEIKR